MKFFRAIQCKVWQASTVEQSRNIWGDWEKEETLKTCHGEGVSEKPFFGMTQFFFVAWKPTDDK